MGASPSQPFAQIAEVDACGPFGRGQVQLHWCDAPRATSAELEAQIEATWVHELSAAQETGAVLFNGQLIRYIAHRMVGGTLHIDVGATDYKSFLGTNLRRGDSIDSIGWSRFANAIGVSALIVSRADSLSVRQILLGHRSQNVVDQPGFIHTFGGALDTADRGADGTIDVFAAVTRELCEELSIAATDIAQLTGLGLVHDRFIWQPELVFAAHLDMPADEVERRVDCASDSAEHDAVERIDDRKEPLGQFIAAHCGLARDSSVPHPSASLKGGAHVPPTPTATPVALSALWLHGCQQFGDGWDVAHDA